MIQKPKIGLSGDAMTRKYHCKHCDPKVEVEIVHMPRSEWPESVKQQFAKPTINPYMDDCAEAYERGYAAGYRTAMSEKQNKISGKDVTGFGVVVCSLCNEIITCRQAVHENPKTFRLDHRKCAIKYGIVDNPNNDKI